MSAQKLYTAAEIAARIAEKRGVSEDQVARVIRHLAREEIAVKPITGGKGPTAPKLWDELLVHRIAILVELNRIGLSDDLVRTASFCLNNMEGLDSIGDPGPITGHERPDRLAEILPELIAGRSYFYHLYLIPDFFQKRGSILGGWFSPNSDGGEPHSHVCSTITINLLPVLPLRQD